MDGKSIPFKLYAKGMRDLMDERLASGGIKSSEDIKLFMEQYHMKEDGYVKRKLDAYLTLEEVSG